MLEKEKNLRADINEISNLLESFDYDYDYKGILF